MKKINRREFIKCSVSSTVFVLGINLSESKNAFSSEINNEESFSPNIWLKIDSQNKCTIILPESEIGQGVFTGLATLIAEELDFDWSQITVERASSADIYGYQTTGGSSSIRSGWIKFRKAGAIARYMFVEAAAKKWKVPGARCQTKNGIVYLKKSDKKFQYSELISDANKVNIPQNIILKNADQFNLIGKKGSRVDSADKVTGKAIYGIDVQLPDMLIATSVHPPVFGAAPGKVDDVLAKEIPGFVKAIKIDNAVAVVAKDYWSASKAAKALKIEWLYSGKLINDEEIKQKLKRAIENKGAVAQSLGEISAATDKKQITAEYSVPLQAHATMEPMNCTVHIHNGICEIWAPTQSPTAAKEIAEEYYFNAADRVWKKVKTLLKSNEDDIVVHTTFSGGGFGRRLKQDFVAEAVQIAMGFSQPVKLIWSREEDMQHDCYRPVSHSKLQAQVDDQGYPVSILHKIASPSIRESLNPGYLKRKKGLDSSAVEGARHLAYAIENHKVIYNYVDLPVPLGYWRSVGASINAYHIESFIDELSHKANIDSYLYRKELLQFNPRILATLNAVASLSGWKNDSHAFYGIACHSSYGSHVSTVAKINRKNNALELSSIYCVIDCGQYVNPDIVKAQLEGSVVFGMSALFSEINIQNGRVLQSNYHDFPMLRYHQVPEIICEIIQSAEDPGGAGEPAVPPTIPAILNAVFAATGERIRDLPIKQSVFI